MKNLKRVAPVEKGRISKVFKDIVFLVEKNGKNYDLVEFKFFSNSEQPYQNIFKSVDILKKFLYILWGNEILRSAHNYLDCIKHS